MINLKKLKNNSQKRRELKKKILFEELKPKIKEIWDIEDKSGSSTLSLIDIRTVIKSLSKIFPSLKISNFEECLRSKETGISEISFEQFSEIFYSLLDNMDIQQELKDFPGFDIFDPAIFVYASGNTVINKNFVQNVFDESIVMRERINEKYTLQGQENIDILLKLEKKFEKTYSDSPYLKQYLEYSCSLRDSWFWIKKYFENKKNVDMGFGINRFSSSIEIVNEKSKIKCIMFQYLTFTSSPRDEALSNLGWIPVSEPFDENSTSKLDEIFSIKETKDWTRAAAISVFHFDFIRAYQFISSIKTIDNETSFMKSILNLLKDWQLKYCREKEIQSLIIHELSKLNESPDEKWDKPLENFNHLQIKSKSALFDIASKEIKFIQSICENLNPKDPYFRAICNFFNNVSSFEHILKDYEIALYDRIAFSFRFCSDKNLKRYLSEMTSLCINKGYLGGIILTGKSDQTIEIMQNYIDITSDIQSASLIGIYLRALKFPETPLYKESLSQYKELMNRLGYWNERIYLEKKIYEVERLSLDSIKEKKEEEKKAKNKEESGSYAASQKCMFCNVNLSHPQLVVQALEFKKNQVFMNKYLAPRMNFCPNTGCQKPLPNCAICLLPVSISNPYMDHFEKFKKKPKPFEMKLLNIEEALVWCQTCKHGGHFEHIEEWFTNHIDCPVSGCMCKCIQNDYS